MAFPAAFLSGSLSAAGGVFSKLALGHDFALPLPARAVLLVAMIVVNSWAMGLYIRGMRSLGAATATVATIASNFLVTAIAGGLLFHEQLNAQWAAGALCIAVGCALLAMSKPASRTEKQRSE